jgi:hypothetical protein
VEEGPSLLHMIPHRAGLSRDPVYTSFLWIAHRSTTVNLTGLGEMYPGLALSGTLLQK